MEQTHLKDELTNFNLITLLGPTATGKTKLAAFLAKELNGEIISADSRQVYKFMDIGTGKDLSDYIVDNINVPYHLINIAEPTEEYNLYRFKSDFYQAFEKIKAAQKLPFLVGGTGMYLSAILQNYKLRKADLSQNRIEELENYSEEKLREILLSIKPKQHNITDLITKERIIKAILIEEANQLCDRVAIINHGKIAAIDTPEKLKQTFQQVQSVEIAFTLSPEGLKEKLTTLPEVSTVLKIGDKWRLYTDSPPDLLPHLMKFSEKENLDIVSLNTLAPSLEDVFLQITGQQVGSVSEEPSQQKADMRRKKGKQS